MAQSYLVDFYVSFEDLSYFRTRSRNRRELSSRSQSLNPEFRALNKSRRFSEWKGSAQGSVGRAWRLHATAPGMCSRSGLPRRNESPTSNDANGQARTQILVTYHSDA